jgi:diadenosine tetraphosphate (Ap4A) HIT family hydrolase
MNSPESGWSLHPQLERDTLGVGDLPLCRVLIIKDANYPWLLLVPRRPDIVDLVDLNEVERAQLMTETNRVAAALNKITKCDKLNVAALGNMVPQLHMHIIGRRKTDAAWPKPVWGAVPPLPFDPQALEDFRKAVRAEVWLD